MQHLLHPACHVVKQFLLSLGGSEVIQLVAKSGQSIETNSSSIMTTKNSIFTLTNVCVQPCPARCRPQQTRREHTLTPSGWVPVE